MVRSNTNLNNIYSINNWPEQDKQKLLSYLGDNALCSNQYKLLYIATPKVACTSLKWWFAELEGYAHSIRQTINSSETDPDLIIHDTFYKVAPSVAGLSREELSLPLTSSDYFRFALVRNPFKRIFSAWQSKLLLREPLQVGPYVDYDFYNQSTQNAGEIALAFERFLEHLAANEAPNYLDVHWTPQADLLRPDLINYSKLVKIENVAELTNALSDRLGSNFVDPFVTRSANESIIPYLPKLFTPRAIELVRLLYAQDFADFGYSDQLPSSNLHFSNEQFDIAIKAIQMIRARHQRFGEIISLTNVPKSADLITALQAKIEELTSGNECLTTQRAAWQNLATEKEQQIIELADKIDLLSMKLESSEQRNFELTSQLQQVNERLNISESKLQKLLSNWFVKLILFATRSNLKR